MGKKKLSDIRIEFISLVENPANGMEIVWKSKEPRKENAADISIYRDLDITAKDAAQIAKTDDEKHLVFATVYEPDTVDSQGDFAEADEIEKAAHLFLGEYRQEFVDTEHNQRMNGSIVVESFIKRGSVEEYPDTKDGAWCVVIKVRDVDTWDKIKNGEIAGVSMFGSAMKTEVEKTAEKTDGEETEPKGTGATLEEFVKKSIKEIKDFILGNNNQPKAKENEMNEAEVKKAIEEAIAPKDAEIAELKKAVEEQKAKIEELEKATIGSGVKGKEDGEGGEPVNSAF